MNAPSGTAPPAQQQRSRLLRLPQDIILPAGRVELSCTCSEARARFVEHELQALLQRHPALRSWTHLPQHQLRAFLTGHGGTLPAVGVHSEDNYYRLENGQLWDLENANVPPLRFGTPPPGGHRVLGVVDHAGQLILLVLEGRQLYTLNHMEDVSAHGVMDGQLWHLDDRPDRVQLLSWGAYVLTDAGTLWVLPHDRQRCPPGIDQAQLQAAAAGRPVRVHLPRVRGQEPRVAQFCGHTHLCTTDSDGRLYAACRPAELLQLCPDPPAPVRDLQARPEGPLALLVDGTVVSVLERRRLPLLSGITAMQGNSAWLGFAGPARPLLCVRAPEVLYRIRDWLVDGGGPTSVAAPPGVRLGAAASPWPIDHVVVPGGETAAEVWRGSGWAVVRTVQGSLWVQGERRDGAPVAGIERSRHRVTEQPDCCRHLALPEFARVERLADGSPAPRFVAAAAGDVCGSRADREAGGPSSCEEGGAPREAVLCIVAQDADGRLYTSRPLVASVQEERLLAPVEGAPCAPVSMLLAAPVPLVLFQDGNVWSIEAGRPLPGGVLVDGLEVDAPPRRCRRRGVLVKFRRTDGRVLTTHPRTLWSAVHGWIP